MALGTPGGGGLSGKTLSRCDPQGLNKCNRQGCLHQGILHRVIGFILTIVLGWLQRQFSKIKEDTDGVSHSAARNQVLQWPENRGDRVTCPDKDNSNVHAGRVSPDAEAGNAGPGLAGAASYCLRLSQRPHASQDRLPYSTALHCWIPGWSPFPSSRAGMSPGKGDTVDWGSDTTTFKRDFHMTSVGTWCHSLGNLRTTLVQGSFTDPRKTLGRTVAVRKYKQQTPLFSAVVMRKEKVKACQEKYCASVSFRAQQILAFLEKSSALMQIDPFTSWYPIISTLDSHGLEFTDFQARRERVTSLYLQKYLIVEATSRRGQKPLNFKPSLTPGTELRKIYQSTEKKDSPQDQDNTIPRHKGEVERSLSSSNLSPSAANAFPSKLGHRSEKQRPEFPCEPLEEDVKVPWSPPISPPLSCSLLPLLNSVAPQDILPSPRPSKSLSLVNKGLESPLSNSVLGRSKVSCPTVPFQEPQVLCASLAEFPVSEAVTKTDPPGSSMPEAMINSSSTDTTEGNNTCRKDEELENFPPSTINSNKGTNPGVVKKPVGSLPRGREWLNRDDPGPEVCGERQTYGVTAGAVQTSAGDTARKRGSQYVEDQGPETHRKHGWVLGDIHSLLGAMWQKRQDQHNKDQGPKTWGQPSPDCSPLDAVQRLGGDMPQNRQCKFTHYSDSLRFPCHPTGKNIPGGAKGQVGARSQKRKSQLRGERSSKPCGKHFSDHIILGTVQRVADDTPAKRQSKAKRCKSSSSFPKHRTEDSVLGGVQRLGHDTPGERQSQYKEAQKCEIRGKHLHDDSVLRAVKSTVGDSTGMRQCQLKEGQGSKRSGKHFSDDIILGAMQGMAGDTPRKRQSKGKRCKSSPSFPKHLTEDSVLGGMQRLGHVTPGERQSQYNEVPHPDICGKHLRDESVLGAVTSLVGDSLRMSQCQHKEAQVLETCRKHVTNDSLLALQCLSSDSPRKRESKTKHCSASASFSKHLTDGNTLEDVASCVFATPYKTRKERSQDKVSSGCMRHLSVETILSNRKYVRATPRGAERGHQKDIVGQSKRKYMEYMGSGHAEHLSARNISVAGMPAGAKPLDGNSHARKDMALPTASLSWNYADPLDVRNIPSCSTSHNMKRRNAEDSSLSGLSTNVKVGKIPRIQKIPVCPRPHKHKRADDSDSSPSRPTKKPKEERVFQASVAVTPRKRKMKQDLQDFSIPAKKFKGVKRSQLPIRLAAPPAEKRKLGPGHSKGHSCPAKH